MMEDETLEDFLDNAFMACNNNGCRALSWQELMAGVPYDKHFCRECKDVDSYLNRWYE